MSRKKNQSFTRRSEAVIKERLSDLFMDIETDSEEELASDILTPEELNLAESPSIDSATEQTEEKVLPAIPCSLVITSLPFFDEASGASFHIRVTVKDKDENRNWTEEEKKFTQEISNQVAIALQKLKSETILTSLNENDHAQQVTHVNNEYFEINSELDNSSSYDEILSVLRKYSILNNNNALSLSINLFDHPWDDKRPEWLIPIARWSPSGSGQLNKKYSVDGWSGFDSLFLPDQVVYIEDTSNYAKLKNMGNKSLVFVPLVGSGQWIGHIIGVFFPTISISPEDINLLKILVEIAAAGILRIKSSLEIHH